MAKYPIPRWQPLYAYQANHNRARRDCFSWRCDARNVYIAFAGIVLAGVATHATSTSPYVGQEKRTIKSLSATEVADLLAGKGLGFAKAAELNGYPGPSHVLELSSQLKLSDEQVAKTQIIFQRMEAEAKGLGARLVEAERELNDCLSAEQLPRSCWRRLYITYRSFRPKFGRRT
jgi:hypothetical protein